MTRTILYLEIALGSFILICFELQVVMHQWFHLNINTMALPDVEVSI